MRLPLAPTALAFAFVASGLPAQTATFAQFTQVKPSQKLLVFDNDGKSDRSIAATFDTANVSSGIDVNFSFSSNVVFTGALASLNGPQKADFIMQSKTDDEARRGSHSLLDQPIDSGTMEFRLETPVEGKDLLLKVVFSEVSLFTSGSSGLESAMEAPRSETKITYSSDFLDFNPSSPDSWTIALSDIDPYSRMGADGALKDFSAAGMGAFQGVASPIPEPKTYGIIAAWVSLVAVLLRRSRTGGVPG
jgi:hypothetical protein